MNKYIAFSVIAFSLAACGQKHHTKEWYKEHVDERHEVAARCQNDAALEKTPDCQNATDVETDEKFVGDPDQGFNPLSKKE